jgi:hypothetical protein
MIELDLPGVVITIVGVAYWIWMIRYIKKK